MNLTGYIDVTELDPRRLISAAYEASSPRGLGFLHARPGGLDEETLDAVMAHAEKHTGGTVRLDYLHGRCMKFDIRAHEGRRYVDLDWYDHGREALKALLRECGLPDVEARIAKAEAEKDEEAREYKARCDRAARAFVKLLAEKGGRVLQQDALFAEMHKRPEGDPINEAYLYGSRTAVDNGWVVIASGEYIVTVQGEALAKKDAT
jgi:hypothetical protein